MEKVLNSAEYTKEMRTKETNRRRRVDWSIKNFVRKLFRKRENEEKRRKE